MVDSGSVAADDSLVLHLKAELNEEKRTLALGWRDLETLLIPVLARSSEWEGNRLSRSAVSSCRSSMPLGLETPLLSSVDSVSGLRTRRGEAGASPGLEELGDLSRGRLYIEVAPCSRNGDALNSIT
jgi:hypothetical protein